MEKLEPAFLGKTFDDFLFRPQYSPVGVGKKTSSRKDIDLTMPLANNFSLALPIIGANMDTVTGEDMMKTLSLEGAFGFLDRHCSIAEQAKKVKYVKTRHSFIIENPLVIAQQATISDAKELRRQYKVSGILVEKEKGSNLLVGILSKKDIPDNFTYDLKTISQFMTPLKRLVTANFGITAEKAEKLMFEKRVEKLPLVDKNHKIKGLITMKDLRMSKQKPHSSKDRKGKLLVGAAIGATGDYLERAEELIKHGADCILIDIAHFHSVSGKKAVKAFKLKFKNNTELVCGNIATAEAALFALELGADAIKVGIGPGKGCRTRLETGAGVPQLQAIREAWLAVGSKIPIIADGGLKNDKDIFLAIACGASSIMLGSMLSGTDESPGNVIEDPVTRQKFKIYRGMTSPEAVLDASNNEELSEKLETPPEGQSIKVPYVGSVLNVLNRIRGHLQSAVSYAGETNLYAVHKKVSQNPLKYLIPLSAAAQRESFDR